MADLYKSLCMELDYLLIDIIDSMESHVACKMDLEKSMNDGFVNIAKTRYINGRSSVTALQLPTEHSNPIQPQATVIRTAHSVQVTNSLSPFNNVDVEKQGPKKRQGKKQDETDDEQKVSDPIRLFGVLVPNSLRSAQKSFITSVDKVGSMASVESELQTKLTRYSRLLKIKKQLMV